MIEALDHAALLRQCGSSKDLAAAKLAHAQIVKDGCGGDRFLGNLLIQMYGKCGSVEEARNIFDAIQQRNVFSWTIMFTAYAENGRGSEALRLYREMDSSGGLIVEDSVMFVSVLRACSVAGDLAEGRAIHDRICGLGYESDVFVATALISMYAKCRSLDDAERVFQNMSDRHLVSWNAMLAAYAQNGRCIQALEVYGFLCLAGIKPDAATFVSVLDAFCRMRRRDGRKIWEQVSESGFGSITTVANAALSMFGSAGFVSDARAVFDRIACKTVVSWNAMLTAYLQNGFFGEAVDLFWGMDLPRNSITYVAVLGAVSELEQGRLIHELIRATADFQADVLVLTGLINMYGRFAEVDEARRCFDEAKDKDMVCWNAMIGVYAQNGYGTEALEVYERLKQARSIKPDEASFVNALVACSSMKLLTEGTKIHAEVTASGVLSSLPVGGALINMYSECGCLDAAVEVFKETRKHGTTLWDPLISAFAHNSLVPEAMYLFRRMSLEGSVPNELTISSIFDACSAVGALDEGSALHGIFGSRSSLEVSNSIINMYGKCGSLLRAQSVFDSLADARNIVSWNVLIGSYAAAGSGRKALELFRRMDLQGLRSDEITYLAVLDACSASEALREGKSIHARVTAAGLESDFLIATSLIKMYGDCRSIDEAEAVFVRLNRKDVVTWTALLSAYSRNGKLKEALITYRRMDLEGVKKNRVTFAAIISACSGGYMTDVIVGTALVDLYGKCNRIDVARCVFSGIHRKDAVSWSVMITAYARHGFGREALRLYQEMDIAADGLTVVGVLAACSSLGSLEAGETLFRRSGFEATDEVVGTALINLYGKCGSLEQALKVFEDIQSKKLITWNSMVAASCTKGSLSDSLKLLHRMGLEGVKPDEVTFLSILFACSHVGMIEQGLEVFVSAETDYYVGATSRHYMSVVDGLGRVGRLSEAEEVVRSMPFEVNDVAWMTLLGACRIHRDFEQGRRAAELVFKFDPLNSAPYALLSNMFAD